MRIRIVLAALAFLSVSAGSAPQSSLQPRTLIVFKSGVSWIEHRGEVPLSNGWGAIPTSPQAILGTVSLTTDGATVDEVRAAGAPKMEANLHALLEKNPGKMVTFRIGDRDLSGRLQSVGPEVLLLAANGKTTAVLLETITSATFEGAVSESHEEATPSLRFHVAGDANKVPVRLTYLRKGLGWFPDYSVVLDDDGNAKLTLRATLVNDGEDLHDTDVLFAVGYPNFKFDHVESPLSARQSLADLFRTLGGSTYQAYASLANVNANLAVNANIYVPDADADDAVVRTEESGVRAEDFFFYTRKNVTLAKGERASFPLLEASAKYSDLYTVDISSEKPNEPAPESADKVWHSIRLRNTTKSPWTTAPALVFANGRPIAQDSLQYAPVSGETTMRLTVANNVVVSRDEAEVARQRDAVRRWGTSWEAVTIDGTITVRNFKDETVTVAISRNIEGDAIAAEGMQVTRGATRPRAMNPSERLQWEVTLRAGEKKTIKYQYKVFVQG